MALSTWLKWIVIAKVVLLGLSAIGSQILAPTFTPPGTVVTVGFFGQRLHVQCRGSGPRLALLFHGVGIDGTFAFESLMDAIETAHPGEIQVCAVDRPGHGFSSVFEGSPHEYSGKRLQTSAKETAEALRSLNISLERPTVVLGFGLGNFYAQSFAKYFPNNVKGALLIDPMTIPTIEAMADQLVLLRRGFDIARVVAYTGILRWATMFGVNPMAHLVHSFSPRAKPFALELLSSPQGFKAGEIDFEHFDDILAEYKRELSSMLALKTTVVSTLKNEYSFPAEQFELVHKNHKLFAEKSLKHAKYVTINTGHYAHNERPVETADMLWDLF